MNMKFNADEVLEIAERIERNGARFYRKAAALTPVNTNEKLLLDLAIMEDQHEKVFAKMRTDMQQSSKAQLFGDMDHTATAYLEAFADGYIFNIHQNPADQIKGHENIQEILKTAITLEKDSVIFYLGIRDIIPEALGKSRVEKIISEEMGHIRYLSDKLKELSS
jgi:rubrerythrin